MFVVIPHYNVGYFAKLVKFAEFYNNARPVPCSQEIGGRGSLFATSGALVCFGSLPTPLISKIMRSRKLVRASGVICITIWPETTSVPAETQLRTPCASRNHRRRFPCNSGLLYRRETLDDFTVTRNDLLGFYDYSVPGPHAERGGAGRLSRRRDLGALQRQSSEIDPEALQ